jgi:hypothetical protein
VTWTDNRSACSWPKATLAADSVSVVLVCTLATVRACGSEVEQGDLGCRQGQRDLGLCLLSGWTAASAVPAIRTPAVSAVHAAPASSVNVRRSLIGFPSIAWLCAAEVARGC